MPRSESTRSGNYLPTNATEGSLTGPAETQPSSNALIRRCTFEWFHAPFSEEVTGRITNTQTNQVAQVKYLEQLSMSTVTEHHKDLARQITQKLSEMGWHLTGIPSKIKSRWTGIPPKRVSEVSWRNPEDEYEGVLRVLTAVNSISGRKEINLVEEGVGLLHDDANSRAHFFRWTLDPSNPD